MIKITKSAALAVPLSTLGVTQAGLEADPNGPVKIDTGKIVSIATGSLRTRCHSADCVGPAAVIDFSARAAKDPTRCSRSTTLGTSAQVDRLMLDCSWSQTIKRSSLRDNYFYLGRWYHGEDY